MPRILTVRVLDTTPDATSPVEQIITADLDTINFAHSGDRIALAWRVADTLQMWMKDRIPTLGRPE